MKHPKTVVFSSIGLLAALLILLGLCLSNRTSTLRSYERSEDGLCSLDYKAPYNVQRFADRNTASKHSLASISGDSFQGVALQARNSEGDRFLSALARSKGQGGPLLLVHTSPEKAYSSLSLVDLSVSGTSGRRLLDAVYFPMDGMNEMGLYVSLLSAGKFADCGMVPTLVVRKMLDSCAGVSDAISLLKQSEDHVAGEFALFVSDSGGNSLEAVVSGNTLSLVRKARKVNSQTLPSGCPESERIDSVLSGSNGYIGIPEASGLVEGCFGGNQYYSLVADQSGQNLYLKYNNHETVRKVR